MKTRLPEGQIIDSILEDYMDLFVMMQSAAVAHWLMFELTFAQARALIMLAAHQSMSLGDLAHLLKIGKATASVLVQGLVERGLVTRTENPSDRREVIICLSEKGMEIGAGRRSDREKQLRDWLKRMPEEDVRALQQGLSALKGVVEIQTSQGAR